MKKILLIGALLLAGASLSAQTADEVKTGLSLGPVPAIAFDADKGFQFGALCNFYDFGDGSNYPNYNSNTYVEASFFSKGSKLFTLYHDNKTLIPGVRIFAGATANIDKAMDFYGFGGYRSFYDAARVDAGSGKNPTASYYSPYYRLDRVQILGALDFTGNITEHLQWELGYHPSYFRMQSINRESINKGKEGLGIFKEESTLYDDYVKWGLIGADESGGGFSSAVRMGLQYDTRDKEGAPTRGIWAEAHLMLAPKWLGTTNPFYRYSATWRQYFPLVDNDILTFAYRLNYQGTFGDSAPFYILPYLTRMGKDFDKDGMGGFDSVRGVMRDRVVGLDMATWTAEFRWRFVKFVLWKQNIAFGLTFFSDGSVVTRDRDMSLHMESPSAPIDKPVPEELIESPVSGYDKYMSQGLAKDRPHITVGSGLRFIMNENFIIAFEYGAPVTAFGGPLKGQDGTGAFYINTGYLF